MKQLIILLVVFLNCSYLSAQWKPAGERIKTEWATKIDVENVLPEYPRPIMERPDWVNLNGLWNYAITPVGQAAPQKYEGQILVPFAIESSLSGVGKRLGKENDLCTNANSLCRQNGKANVYCCILELLTGKLIFG